MSFNLNQHYEAIGWPDDPCCDAGKRYEEKVHASFLPLFNSKEFSQILAEKSELSILEVCSGVGYGANALAKKLHAVGKRGTVTLSDLREPALLKGKQWFNDQFPEMSVTTDLRDVRSINEIGQTYDIVLMYGLSAAHFNPWEMVQITHQLKAMVSAGGCFLMHETDRRLLDLLQNPYEKVALSGNYPEVFSVSIHQDYDVQTGMVQRAVYPIGKEGESQLIKTYYWGIAELGAILWTAFSSVEVVSIGETRYFLVSTKPRIG